MTTVALPYGSTAATCPVRSYRSWVAAAKITTGPAFRSVDRHGRVGWERMNAGSVARLIKRAAEAAGPRSCRLRLPQPARRLCHTSMEWLWCKFEVEQYSVGLARSIEKDPC